MDALLIKNGTLYDGLGHPATAGDLLVDGGIIRRIGQNLQADRPCRIVDAAGKVVCPGFIDIHRHCDMKLIGPDDFGGQELLQGITSTVVGNCGISLTPAPRDPDACRALRDFQEPVLGAVPATAPADYTGYLTALKARRQPLNVAAMPGTGSIRVTVKGFASTPYTPAESARARALVEQALALGAPGVSLGIMYLPECYTTLEEYARILEPVGQAHRVLTVHIRAEGNRMVESVAEAIEIARRAGCALEISHFKSCGKPNWRRDIHRAIGLIERARAEGQDVTCDFYPYDSGSTALTAMLPPDMLHGDLPGALAYLGTAEGVREFTEKSRRPYADWDNFALLLGWDRILISSVRQEKFRPMLGMSITEASETFGYPTPESLAADLMHVDEGKTAIINRSMCQEDIDTVARLPYSTVISDAIYAETDSPHPRMYGAFPKILREYVRERGLLSLEQAIHKMTGLPAARMGLVGRGVLREGYAADLLVFDPALFRDNATYSAPTRPATGLSLALVNGQIAVENGSRTTACAGKVLQVE